MTRLGVSAALVDGRLVRGDVEVDADGTITAVGVGDGVGDAIAVPGLVDLQINGAAGVDLRRADQEGYARVADLLVRHGATAIQPTFYSQPIEAHCDSLERLAHVLAAPPVGCRLLPAHLEGPFLATARRGAHDASDLCDPDTLVADRLLHAGPMGMMTLAPELPGALDVVRHLVGRGVVVSLGHTDATAAEVRAAVLAGARHVTHCWNAQRPPVARAPGPVGVALSDPTLTVGLIADLVHVAPEVVQLSMAAAAGRVAATTDAVQYAGLRSDEWPVGEAHPQLVDGAPRLADGTIAGGVALPDDCLRNLVGLGVELSAAVDACGGAQRRLLGLAPVRLVPGEQAELVVLDQGLAPLRTLVGGRSFECA
jgi:N-acetylglucosamine-6-phosphate deacetylase